MTSTQVRSVVLVLAFGIGKARGQTMSYLRQFTTPSIERATAVAADASGVYVVGDSRSGQAGLRKYDARGNELWTREFGGPQRLALMGVAVASDAVYAVGSVGSEPQTSIFKYSADGTARWTRQLVFAGAASLAADATGVYVTGWDSSPNGTYLRKYSADGTELWTSRLGSAPTLDYPRGIAVDATGVYVLLMTGPSSELVTRKFDADGRSLWTRPNEMLIGSPGTGIATDATGVYVLSGYRTGGHALSKVDPTGNEVWIRRLDRFFEFFNGRYLGGVYPSGLTADASGVYFAGWKTFARALPGQCSSSSGGDSFVSKYDRDGAEVWTREFGTPDAAWASGIAVDANGVYVVGEEGTAMFIDDVEWRGLSGPLAPSNVSRGAFLARFERSAAVVAGPGPRIFPGCVVNAASYVGGGVAPGEMVTLFGSKMGPAQLVASRVTEERKLATLLAGTRILFDGVAAPLVYASAQQSSAIVPFAVAGKSSVDVQVEYQGVRSGVETVPVLTSRPGIFSLDGSGDGQGAILNEDGSLNSPANPARRGSIVTLYATGGGEAAAGIEDGQILGNVVPRTSLPVAVLFDLGNNEFPVPSKAGEVLYAGGVSGSVAGLLQVNVRVPANAVATGNAVPFVLVIGSHWTVYPVGMALR
ncbi:MAG: PQQ-binding-like beta-propeller repeat protein [Bryobacteraceae bacterium]|nr:PQQ-binding-like beta-propeller repeat protein [Bryobacteraceae bacterium]